MTSTTRWISRWGLILLLVGITVCCSSSPEAKVARYLKTGKNFLERRDYPRAILQFKNAAKLAPKDAEPYYQLALAFLAQGALREGLGALNKALELNPKHTAAELKLAQLMSASGNKELVEKAEARLENLVAAEPGNAEALDALAGAEARLGKLEDAEKHLQEALNKTPAYLKASVNFARLKLLQKDVAGAEEVLQKAVRQAPQSVDAALALGHFYIVTRRPAQAQAEMHRALGIDPRNGPALATLAALQLAAGQKGQAEESYRKASQLPDPRYRPLLGHFLFQQGRHEDALREFARVAQQDPSDRAARSRLVAAYVATQRVADAERVLAAAIRRNSRDVTALFERGALYIQSGKDVEAEKDFQQVLHYQADSGRARYGLARVYRLRGRELLYRAELEQALRLRPDLLAARIDLANDLVAHNSSKTALQVLDQTPAPQKQLLGVVIARNWALLAAGDEAAARADIMRALAIARVPDLLLQDALLKSRAKDLKGALAGVEEALKQSPGDVRCWQLLADIYTLQNRFPQAVEQLRQALSQQPRSAALQYLLGGWLLRAQNRAAARAAFDAAKAADPAFIAADLSLAQLDLADGRIDAARRVLTDVLATRGTNIPARLLLAMLEERAAQPAAAIAQYRLIVSADEQNVLALNNLAYLLVMSSPAEALNYAQKAAALDSNAPSVQDTLGWAYYHNGMYDAAIRHLETAIAKESTGRRKYHLGMAYLKRGDRELAQKTLQAALAMDPKLPASEPELRSLRLGN